LKLEHIGIVVKDLARSLKAYQELLGVSAIDFEEVNVEGNRATIAFLPFGQTKVELIQPKDDAGILPDFLRERGEDGIHHLAFEVDDIESFYEKMKSKGVTFLWDGIRTGSRGSKVFFFKPEVFQGYFVEIVEKPKQ